MPVKHVRLPVMPWRTESNRAECGNESANLITRDEFIAIANATFPDPRARMSAKGISAVKAGTGVCRRCWAKIHEHRTWDQDPVNCLQQHLQLSELNPWTTSASVGPWMLAVAELRALADLVAADPDGFQRIVQRHRALLALSASRERR